MNSNRSHFLTKYALIFIILSGTLLKQAILAQPSKALKNLSDKVVASYLGTTELNHSIAIGIIDGPYTYQFYYGKISESNLNPPDSSSIFLLGSLSKIITTSVMAAMSEEQIIQPSDSITKFLPDSVYSNNPFLSSITFQKLATHTALLPRTPYNLPATLIEPENTYGNYQVSDLYLFLKNYRPVSGIFKKNKSKKLFVYSHTGIGLLAHLLENASGLNFDKLIQRYLSPPLLSNPLTNTGIRLSSNQKNRLLPGHLFSGKQAFSNNFASMYGSEGVYSSLPDMLTFVRACMSKSVFTPALQPLFNTQMPDVKVGWGWYVILNGKRQPVIYTHSGKTSGYSNYLAFEKEREVAVVVLSNSDNRIDKIGIDLLDLLLR